MRTLFFSLLFVFLPVMPAFAQETPVSVSGNQVATEATPAAATNAEELRKQSQNPIANLISVPLQENFNFGIGPADRTQNVLNIQPVIPFSLGKDWNLITRWIMPIIYQPLPVPQPPGATIATDRSLRLGRHEPFILPLTEGEQGNMGCRHDLGGTYGY